MDPLSDLDTAILDFEENAPRSIGRKEEAIRAQLDISPVRYHQRLNPVSYTHLTLPTKA